MKAFEGAFLEKFSKKELPAISACRWMVASKAISRGTVEEANRVWSQVRLDIKSTLKKSPIDREDTLAAFKCCVAAWLANHPGADQEDDAASLICSFVERLEKEGGPVDLESATSGQAVTGGTYLSWILSDAPRILR
jgi:nucleolar pre-ribosomal-associated protein 2